MMNRSSKEVLHSIKKLITLDIPLWIISIIGAIITSIPWYITYLVSGVIMKISLDAIVSKNNIWNAMMFSIIIIVFLRVPTIIGYKVNSWSSEKLSSKLQLKLINCWMQKMSAKSTKYDSGDIMTILLNDCSDKISDFYFQGFGLKVLEPIVTGIAAMVTIIMIDYKFLILPIITGIISSIAALFFSNKVKRMQLNCQSENSKLSQAFSEIMYGILTIKIFNIGKQKENEFTEHCISASNYAFKVEYINKLTTFITEMLDLINIVGCFMIGKIVAMNGTFIFSNIMIVLQMQNFVSNMVANVGKAWNYFVEVSVSGNRVYEIIDKFDCSDNKNRYGSLNLENDTINLTVRDLYFAYSNDYVLKDISFTLNKGELIAVIGSSGCGKSTLLKTLIGLFDEYEGNIKINGQEMRDCALNEWRRAVNLFQQEESLFDQSILDNILLGRESSENISQDEIVTAAKKAGVHDFIMGLPNEYYTKVGELGNNLSGGEKQKIVLSRAFISKSPILLLDEPTSALDNESERIICNSLNSLKHEKALLISTHKLMLLEMADNIIVMNKGKVEEVGTHEELLKKGGYYFDLYKKGFENI